MRKRRIKDITQRVKAGGALAESEKYRTLIENLNEGVWMTDVDSNTTFTNQRMAEMLGYTVEEMVGRNMFEFMEGQAKELAEENWRGAQGECEQYDFEFCRKDGSKMYAALETSPLTGRSGEYVGTLAGVMDITERRAAEERLKEAERKYRELAETLPLAVFEYDFKGKFIYANQTGLQMLGYTEGDMEKVRVMDLIDPTDHGRVGSAITKMVDGRSDGAVREYLFKRKDGSTFPGRAYTTLISNPEGERLGVRGIMTDITEERRREEELLAAKERWERSFADVGEGIFIIDKDFRIIQCNRGIAGLVGMEPEEMVGRKCYEVIHGTDAPPDFCITRRALLEKKGVSGETWEPNLNRYLEVTADPVLDSKGELESAIHIIRDVSERKMYEQALERVNTELDGFAHTVSHDLRSPLSGVSLARDTLERLLQAPPSDEGMKDVSELLETMKNHLRRTNDLVEDLLKLAEAGQVPKEVSVVDVGEVVDSVLEEQAGVVREEGISVIVDDDLGKVTADPTHVYQLFANLIRNAIEHNDSANPQIRVSFLGCEPDGGSRYLVRDNGSGIPAEELDKVFLPFQKGTSGVTGVGLSIVDKIVKVYRGEISAYNNDGACFELLLRDINA